MMALLIKRWKASSPFVSVEYHLSVTSFVETDVSGIAGSTSSWGRKTIESLTTLKLCYGGTVSALKIIFITCRKLESPRIIISRLV